jgi:predicted RNA-binding protein associated with RNAse of E/G family
LKKVTIEYLRPPGPPELIQSELVHQDGYLTVFRHCLSPSSPVVIDGETVLAEGFTGVWFLYDAETYDLGRIHDAAGRLTGYYCDMILPMELLTADRFAITDLFLDLWISPRGRCTVLDRHEFEDALRRGWITTEEASRAEQTLDRLLREVAAGTFPPKLAARIDLYPWRE